jgi:hypothetical protein
MKLIVGLTGFLVLYAIVRTVQKHPNLGDEIEAYLRMQPYNRAA